ncbi:peroxide stress protein YaaA [Marinomonas agarivorans]|nr:peroxide stress protein YaaA [Marinomonas agarivorans]
MKFLISPAKTLDLDSPIPTVKTSIPVALDKSQVLIDTIKPYTPAQVASLMKLSDKLASLNVTRYNEWQTAHTIDNSRPALFTFKGDVYTGLDAHSLSTDDIHYAQQHLRMLSGLYGLLKPLDLMQAYRLEMGIRLPNPAGSNLYQFWGDHITQLIVDELAENEILVNLASNEYFKSVNTKLIKQSIVSPIFLDEKNGQYKVISFYAKKARGLMARFLIQARCETYEELLQFNLAGYCYDETRSKENEPVFTRSEAVAAQMK